MSAKLKGSSETWVDPDDAPELTEEFFEKAEYRIGDRLVSKGEGKTALQSGLRRGRPAGTDKTSTTLRLDNDVVAYFRGAGKGWQTRINEALREFVKNHPRRE